MSRCVHHNRVISWCVHHTLSRCVRHTPHDVAVCPSQPDDLAVCPPHTSRCVHHNRVISRCVRHTLSQCVRHTPHDIAMCLSQLGDLAVCPSHTLAVCPSHTARCRDVFITTARYRVVSVTHCTMSRCVRHNQVISRCVCHTLSRCVRHTPHDVAMCPSQPRDIAMLSQTCRNGGESVSAIVTAAVRIVDS